MALAAVVNRSDPRPGDRYYLHLTDLRADLARRLADASGRWLDYGAGTSPYRELLPSVDFWTADLDGQSDAKSVGCTPEGCLADDATFDGVLSTQVLEHVKDPDAYLREVLRLLAPGGRLVLSTHGSFHEHPCPIDHHRWTLSGLRDLVVGAGFEVDDGVALTCGPRAALCLLAIELGYERPRWRGPWSLPLVALGWMARHAPRRFDAVADAVFPDFATSGQGGEALYVAIVVEAHKPLVARAGMSDSASTGGCHD